MSETFDHIVIGGGSAGCIAAAELSDDPTRRVLLLEAGPPAEDHPETLHADGYKYAFINDEVIWERFSAPQGRRGNRLFMGSGTVLGGSGSVNGMVYTRGSALDYDEWPSGWRWSDLEPDFAAIERRLRPRSRPATRWTEACISAAVACGFERRDDLNDGQLSNVVGYERMNYEGAARRSSYVAFIKETRRPNLTVVTHAKAHRIIFDESRRAVAVEYLHAPPGLRGAQRGERRRAQVTGEVLLCAGALETPKLLMLSGIGSNQALRFAKVPQVLELAGVGQNLHDHPNVPLFFSAGREIDCFYPQLYSFYRTNAETNLPAGQSDTCYVFWPAPSAMKQAVQRMLPGQILPPSLYASPLKGLVRRGVGAAFALPPVQRVVRHLYGIIVILGKPYSRGSVRLATNDPEAPATYDPCYLSDPRDIDTLVRGVRKARTLSESGGLRAWNSAELMPGKRTQSDDAIRRYVESNVITTFHYAGTCRMGSDDRSVCDPQLRLRGVQNVRIADASAIPTTPVSALNAPSMLIGYRAARYVRGG